MILCDEMNVPRVMPNKLGERMAGQRKRKKMDAEMRWSATSSRPKAAKRWRYV